MVDKKKCKELFVHLAMDANPIMEATYLGQLEGNLVTKV